MSSQNPTTKMFALLRMTCITSLATRT